MAKIVTYFLAIVFLLALNIVFPTLRASTPSFLFLLVVIYAFRLDNPGYLWFAFFSGLMLDVYSNVFFGSYILSFLIIALLINYTTRTFFSADPSLFYVATVIAVSNLILVGLLYFINSIGMRFDASVTPLSGVYLGGKIWFDVILNLVFAAPMYSFTIWIDRIVEHFERKNQAIL